MWQLWLVAVAGTGFLSRYLRKRSALPSEEEPTENGVLIWYDGSKGSVRLDSELCLELPTQISNGEGLQIVGDRKIDPSVCPINEQASEDLSTIFITSHGRSPVMPSSWKGKAKGLHGYGGKLFGLDAQCSETRDFQLSEDHGSNCSSSWSMRRIRKRDLRKKTMTGLHRKRKASRHVGGKKLDADIVGHCQQSHGALCFSYGVGIGVIFVLASRNCEIDKLTSLLNQTVVMVQELKKQLDERKDYLQNSKMPEGFQQEKSGAAANWTLEKDSEYVGSSSKDNKSARSVKVELEADLQVGLQYIQMDFLQSNSKHQRGKTEYGELTDSLDVVEGGLYADGVPGQWSSANYSPFVPSEVSHADDYGVSPYELDRRLCHLLEKQQEERISELEVELKSAEIELHVKERELQHWKEHVGRLLELSFGANSGDDFHSLDYVSVEKTNNADGKRQNTRQASLKSTVKSVINSEHEGNYKFPLWSFNHFTEDPLDCTSDSMEQCNYRGETNTHWMN